MAYKQKKLCNPLDFLDLADRMPRLWFWAHSAIVSMRMKTSKNFCRINSTLKEIKMKNSALVAALLALALSACGEKAAEAPAAAPAPAASEVAAPAPAASAPAAASEVAAPAAASEVAAPAAAK
ncbi:MAG TPA: hypothetical protein VFW53_11085 [Gallionella sp.]|nr:hypothetical protein [Gallionella sp.]